MEIKVISGPPLGPLLLNASHGETQGVRQKKNAGALLADIYQTSSAQPSFAGGTVYYTQYCHELYRTFQQDGQTEPCLPGELYNVIIQCHLSTRVLFAIYVNFTYMYNVFNIICEYE